ncbi:MAG: hypothetical protein GY914_12555, partial [Prochlorococcus sp.]|nr:hypothetical protein [Prochlorococcus sp.]
RQSGRKATLKWLANMNQEDKENYIEQRRQYDQEYKAEKYPVDPAVYCLRLGPQTFKVGEALRPEQRKKQLYNSADLMYARLYFLAKFDTIKLAHKAEKGAHFFLEFTVGLPRLNVPSGKPSEQFVMTRNPKWLFRLKDFLSAQDGFKHFVIYEP